MLLQALHLLKQAQQSQLAKAETKIAHNEWRYGLVKADHYRSIEEQNLIQPLLTIPLVIGM